MEVDINIKIVDGTVTVTTPAGTTTTGTGATTTAPSAGSTTTGSTGSSPTAPPVSTSGLTSANWPLPAEVQVAPNGKLVVGNDTWTFGPAQWAFGYEMYHASGSGPAVGSGSSFGYFVGADASGVYMASRRMVGYKWDGTSKFFPNSAFPMALGLPPSPEGAMIFAPAESDPVTPILVDAGGNYWCFNANGWAGGEEIVRNGMRTTDFVQGLFIHGGQVYGSVALGGQWYTWDKATGARSMTTNPFAAGQIPNFP